MYSHLAYMYDELIYDIDYKKLSNYIVKIFDKFKLKPNLILDLGCGTGSLTVELAKKGFEMIGLDISTDMLSCAQDKSISEDLDIIYLNQDIRSFELFGTVDSIISTLDCMNYILKKNELLDVFNLVSNYLNPNGLFIFDINTEFKLKNKLDNNVFYDVDDDISYIWQNKFNKKSKVIKFEVTMFVKEGELYRKFEEEHYQRAYSYDEISKLLKKANLKLEAIFDNNTLNSYFEESEKVFFVVRKEI